MYHSLLDYYAISTSYRKKLAQMCESLLLNYSFVLVLQSCSKDTKLGGFYEKNYYCFLCF